jgi:prepilin-type N-terminal cleavage/methylation domain-containing protein
MPRRGFTLLELTLVTTIAGLLLALVAPRFASLRDGSSVHSAMGELGAAFSAARQEAITRRAAVAVVFDTAGGSVEIRSGGRTILRRTLRTVYGISLGANRDSAVYDARGLGYGVSNLSVTVRRGSIVDTLTMSRLGRVRW